MPAPAEVKWQPAASEESRAVDFLRVAATQGALFAASSKVVVDGSTLVIRPKGVMQLGFRAHSCLTLGFCDVRHASHGSHLPSERPCARQHSLPPSRTASCSHRLYPWRIARKMSVLFVQALFRLKHGRTGMTGGLGPSMPSCSFHTIPSPSNCPKAKGDHILGKPSERSTDNNAKLPLRQRGWERVDGEGAGPSYMPPAAPSTPSLIIVDPTVRGPGRKQSRTGHRGFRTNSGAL